MGAMLGQVAQVQSPSTDMTSAVNVFMILTMMAGVTGGI
jgi:hypothetical protein